MLKGRTAMVVRTECDTAIAPEAARRVAHLGLEREFSEMLEHVSTSFPCLVRIDVVLSLPVEECDDPIVYFQPVMQELHPGDALQRHAWDAWCDWQFGRYSPDVIRHFNLLEIYEKPNAG
jgi:hypothetical protein